MSRSARRNLAALCQAIKPRSFIWPLLLRRILCFRCVLNFRVPRLAGLKPGGTQLSLTPTKPKAPKCQLLAFHDR